MLARWLQYCLVVEAAILLIAPVVCVRTLGWQVSAATAIAVAALFVLNSVPLILAFLIALYCRRRTDAVPHIGTAQLVRGIATEWLAFLAVFAFIQPFERWWMGGESVTGIRGGRPLLVLVHGYAGNCGQWWWLRRRLRARGFSVATINLEPPHGDIDAFAEQLHARIETLLRETGGERVSLIAHSMGGLVSRAYLRRHGSERVSSLITLGTPHHGTVLAYLAPGRCGRQMRPNSAWLQRLSREESLSLRVLSVWGGIDQITAPQDSSRLPPAGEKLFPAMAHLSMLFSPAVLAVLLAELERSDQLNNAGHVASA
jgi:triacylglycerol lipase